MDCPWQRRDAPMKRSEINALLRDTVTFIKEQGFCLPPFAFWSPAEWKSKGPEADEIRDCMLGWDVTDFGLGDFHQVGLILFTLRNGHPTDERYAKPYAEKRAKGLQQVKDQIGKYQRSPDYVQPYVGVQNQHYS